MSVSSPLLQVANLVTRFGAVTAVDGVSFDIRPGEIFGLVGESGCGKSATCRSLIRLFGGASAEIAAGSILFEGQDLAQLSNLVYSPRKVRSTLPMGPFRCLPIMISAMPLSCVSGL